MHSLDPSNPVDNRIKQALLGVDVIIPGRILSYSEKGATPLVSVENAFYRKYKNSEPLALPVLKDVPFVHYHFKSAAIFPPVSEIVGSNCLLLVCQRSIDEWLDTGRQTVQFESRYFSTSDAVAIPGPVTNGNLVARKGASESLVVQYDSGYFEISKEGFKLQKGETTLEGDSSSASLKSGKVTIDGSEELSLQSKSIKISGAELLKSKINELIEVIKASKDSGGDTLDAKTILDLEALKFDEVL